MKKLFFAMTVLLGVMLISSCSGDSTAKLLKAIPAETDVVFVGNAKTIIESAGGSMADSQIKLPKLIADKLDANDTESFEKFNEMLKNSGIDTEQAALTMSYEEGHPLFVFLLKDPSKFISYIGEKGYEQQEEKDGAKYYSKKTFESEYDEEYDDYSYVAVKDQYAYFVANVWVKSEFKPFKAIEKMIEDADKESMSATEIAEYISSGNAGGVSIRIPEELRKEMGKTGIPTAFAEMYKGYVCFNGSLDGDKGTLNIKWFNEDGKAKSFDELTDYFSTNALISKDVLAYMNTNEQVVFAVAMEDVKWDKYFEMISKMPDIPSEAGIAFSVASAYLEKINGTMALGFGLNDGLKSIAEISNGRNVLAHLPATVIIQTNEGKAEGMMKDVKGIIQSAGLPFTETADGWTLEVPELGGSVYGKAVDNMLIFSTAPISKDNSNPTVRNVDFDKYLACGGVVLNRDNKLMRDLGIDYDITAYSTSKVESMEGSMVLQIEGGENEGLIAKAIRIGFGIADRQRIISEQWADYSGNYFEAPEFPADSVAVEEVVEEVVAE